MRAPLSKGKNRVEPRVRACVRSLYEYARAIALQEFVGGLGRDDQ